MDQSGVNIDLTGCERLFRRPDSSLPGTVNVAHRVIQALRRTTAQLALAPTLGSAWAFARYGNKALTIIEEDELFEKLAPLPLAALRLDPHITAALQKVNINTVSELTNLPPSTVLSRFGDAPLKRIRQALGLEEDLIAPFRQPSPLKFTFDLPTPTLDLTQLERAAEFTLGQLVSKLSGEQRHVSRLLLELVPYQYTPGQPISGAISRIISLTLPTLDLKHLLALVRLQLQTVFHSAHSVVNSNHQRYRADLRMPNSSRLLTEGITQLTLSPIVTEHAPPRHTTYLPPPELPSSYPPSDANNSRYAQPFPIPSLIKITPNQIFLRTENPTPPALGVLIDLLSEQLGLESVLALKTRASHIPEQSFEYIPFKTALSSFLRATPPSSKEDLNSIFRDQLGPFDRPSIIFRKPLPVKTMALLPDSPPFWLKLDTQVLPIRNTTGPERIAPEWWTAPTYNHLNLKVTRDYFKVQLDCGLWLWIYREGAQSLWYIHGVWS